jgi:hypothetical protein
MTTDRAVPNIRSDRPARDSRVLRELLGFEVATELGWVVTSASPTIPSNRVTIVGYDDPAAPGISVELDDVDAVHAGRWSGASRSSIACATKRGGPTFHALPADGIVVNVLSDRFD